MCYSAEVSAVAGVTLLVGAVGIAADARFNQSVNIRSTFLWYAMVVGLVGLHQVSEAVAIWGNNEMVYKLGLGFSICAPYCMMRCMASVTKRELWTKLVIALTVAGWGSVLLTGAVEFENKNFWVRGFSHGYWLLLYLALVGIGVVHLLAEKNLARRYILWQMALGSSMFSFAGALVYVLVGWVVHSVNFMQDFPSLWCTFFVFQLLFYPWLRELPRGYHKGEWST